MNPISNIEIINFEELNDKEQSIDFKQEISLNYKNNFINDNSDSKYLESQSNANNCESSCKLNLNSDSNSIFFSNQKKVNDSCQKFNDFEQNACSDNFETPNSKSFKSLEKIKSNSFSYLGESAKFKIFIDKNLNISTQSDNSGADIKFKCTYEKCEKVYKSKENLTLHYKNIHLKEKPYSCIYCGSQFSHRNGKYPYSFRKKFILTLFQLRFFVKILQLIN